MKTLMVKGCRDKIQIVVSILFLIFIISLTRTFADKHIEIRDLNKELKQLDEVVNRLYQKGLYKKAVPFAKRRLKIIKKTHDSNHPETARSLDTLAELYKALGDYRKAESLCRQALKIYKKISGPNPDIVRCLNSLAGIYMDLGEYGKAGPLCRQALKIAAKVHGADHPYPAVCLNNLAELYYALGEYGKAETLYEQVLEIYKKTLDPAHPDLATIFNNLAGLYYTVGDYGRAEKLYEQALEIYKKAFGPDHPNVAISLNNLAKLYHTIGEYGKAEQLVRQMMKTAKNAYCSDHPDVAMSLNNLAELYYALGEYGRAEPLYKQALKIYRNSFSPDHPDVAVGLNNLAALFHAQGKYGMAEPLYEQALKINKKAFGIDHPNAIINLNNLADLYLADNRPDKAFKIFKKQNNFLGLGRYYLVKKDYEKAKVKFYRALIISKKTKAKNPVLASYIGLGLSFDGRQDHKKESQKDHRGAKEYFREAIKIIEAQWITLSSSAKKCFLTGKTGGFCRLEAYEGLMRVILKEKSKDYEKEALNIAEQVKARILLELLAARRLQGKNKEDEDILKKYREFKRELFILRTRLEVQERLDGKAFEEKRNAVKKELKEKETNYALFIQDTRHKNPELASLFSMSLIPIEKIQGMLDKEATLLEYYTTKNKMYAWLVTKKNIRVIEISLDRNKLREVVNDVFLDISQKKRMPDFGLPGMPEKENREKFPFLQACKHLYQNIFAPFEKEIRTRKLFIVPHGVLHKVPFAALSTNGKDYLIDQYHLCSLPSANSLFYLKKKSSSQKRFLSFTNPKTKYPGLIFAEEEAKKISSFFKSGQVYKRSSATETLFKKKSGSFEVIHLATHGEFNERQPLQSGIFFTKDQANDGFLQVYEVFGLDLPNTHLVTLSACETALCKVQGGDDLVGLSRGFFYAGTPSLLATLWQVDDKSTSLLMEHFYKNWLNGMSKSKALQQAQIYVKKSPAYAHPYYWASFILFGR